MKSISCLFIALGVVAGAFGAHALKDIVTPERLEVFKTGVSYQISMSIVALIFSALKLVRSLYVKLLLAGVVIFSGSLYLLVIFNIPILGAVTPIGGTLIIVSLLLSAYELRVPT